MRRLLLFLLLPITMLLSVGFDSETKDTLNITDYPSKTYFPYDADTVAVDDTTNSVWYWINNPALRGVGSITYEIVQVGANNVATKFYEVYTNDTLWTDSYAWVLIDSCVATTTTTVTFSAYGAKWMRFSAVGWQRVNVNDQSYCRSKFTLK